MKHLRKAAALLITVLLLVFVLPRVLPTSSALEGVGFYPNRSEQDTMQWATRPIQYVETSLCNSCHNNKQATWAKSSHSNVSCEDCHGPAAAHVDKRASLVIDTSREACGVCHGRVTGRPASFPQVDLEQHGGQAACVTCHNPHSPTIAARPAVIPHSLEGRADCLICHKVGGVKPVPADHQGRTSTTCLSCHRSK